MSFASSKQPKVLKEYLILLQDIYNNSNKFIIQDFNRIVDMRKFNKDIGSYMGTVNMIYSDLKNLFLSLFHEEFNEKDYSLRRFDIKHHLEESMRLLGLIIKGKSKNEKSDFNNILLNLNHVSGNLRMLRVKCIASMVKK